MFNPQNRTLRLCEFVSFEELDVLSLSLEREKESWSGEAFMEIKKEICCIFNIQKISLPFFTPSLFSVFGHQK
jgi:hypothetical protein